MTISKTIQSQNACGFCALDGTAAAQGHRAGADLHGDDRHERDQEQPQPPLLQGSAPASRLSMFGAPAVLAASAESESRASRRLLMKLSRKRGEVLCPLPHRDHQAVEVGADDRADRVAAQGEHRAVLIGQHDSLRTAADGRADIACGIDAGDVRRAADVAHRAAKARLRRAEGEPVADAANPERVPLAVEEQRARARRAANHQARLDDAEADAALVGMDGGCEGGAGQGQHGDQACTKSG